MYCVACVCRLLSGSSCNYSTKTECIVFPSNIENRFRYLSNGPSLAPVAASRFSLISDDELSEKGLCVDNCGVFFCSILSEHVDFGFPIKRRNISASQCVIPLIVS